MEKGKKLIGIVLGMLITLSMAHTTLAMTPVVHITQLPEYTTTNSFKLSYSALTDDPASISAQFSAKKDGGAYTAFGGTFAGANGQVQVTDVQIPTDGKYCFIVEIAGASSETCSTYDSTHPANPYNFRKEQVGVTTMRIRWTNPSDTDYDVTYIYRGEQPDFSADEGHKVGGLGGTFNEEMSYDDNGLDLANKTYYYAIRSFDKAGNGSGLIGDSVVNTTVLGTSTGTGTGGSVTALPKEKTGEVLSEETTTPTEAVEKPSVVNQALTRIATGSKLKWIALGAFLIGIASYFILRRRK